MPHNDPYQEAYNVALKTLTEIMVNDGMYSAEDRIEAADTILSNEPRDKGEQKANA